MYVFILDSSDTETEGLVDDRTDTMMQEFQKLHDEVLERHAIGEGPSYDLVLAARNDPWSE